jgi:Nucleoside-diphosphate-sugar epimerases
MRILFTGSTGFLGKNFLDYVTKQADKDKIEIIPLLTSKEENGISSYNFKRAEISDFDILVHAGAFSPKKREDLNDVQNNIKSIANTQYLLENLPKIPKKIIFISSISVYNANYEGIIDENTVTDADSLYGLSKLMSERVIIEYARKNNVPYQILRLGVIYGNNIIYNGVIPTVIKNIVNDRALKVYNGGQEYKNFIHVHDCCRVMFKALTQQVKDPIINVVSEKSIQIIVLIKKLISDSGKEIFIENSPLDRNISNTLYNAKVLVENFGKNEIEYDQGLSESYKFFCEELRGKR